MTPDELLFFDRHPAALPLYGELKDRILEEIPDARIKVGKTQISFFTKHMFAAAISDRILRPVPSGRFSPHRCGGGTVSGPLDASCHDRLHRRSR